MSGGGLHGDLRDNRQKASWGEGDEEQERQHGGTWDSDQLGEVLPDVVNKVNDQQPNLQPKNSIKQLKLIMIYFCSRFERIFVCECLIQTYIFLALTEMKLNENCFQSSYPFFLLFEQFQLHEANGNNISNIGGCSVLDRLLTTMNSY